MLFYVYQRLTMIRRYVVSAISLLRSLELWVENFILPCLLSTFYRHYGCIHDPAQIQQRGRSRKSHLLFGSTLGHPGNPQVNITELINLEGYKSSLGKHTYGLSSLY